jgi:hypothetical protein
MQRSAVGGAMRRLGADGLLLAAAVLRSVTLVA